MLKVYESEDCCFCKKENVLCIMWMKFSKNVWFCPQCWINEILRPMLEEPNERQFEINLFDDSKSTQEKHSTIILDYETIEEGFNYIKRYLN